MNKKEILFDLIQSNKADTCTILGVPKMELLECILKGNNIMDFFKQKCIKIPYEIDSDNLEHTFINIYTPRADKNIYSISISKKANITIELVQAIITNFFDEVVDIFQFDITPAYIEMILNNKDIKFEDILKYITQNTSQRELAKNIGCSEQFITELKKDRKNMSIEFLSSFMQQFPLHFWNEYITNINK